LRSLDLDENKIVDISPLAELKSLNDLSLKGEPFGDLMPLAKLPKLKYLIVKNSPVSKEQVEELQKALPNCQIIYKPIP
jgi:Leucine-rich repeat (LRR) protein